MKEHFHDLYGSGIAEDKRMVNAKTPYTLQQLSSTFLKSMMANPEVPPSMKTKLKETLELKGGKVCMSDKAYKDEHKRLIHALDTQDPKLLRAELKEQTEEIEKRGGRAGVSKASGFIQRMMAENKLKHKGQYKKPTAPPAADSSMKAWVPFDYKKLANKDQGGDGEARYGASPFIQKYFAGPTKKFSPGGTAKESAAQRAWRKGQPKVGESAETPTRGNPELAEHFGNKVEEPKPRKVFKLKKKEEAPAAGIAPVRSPEEVNERIKKREAEDEAKNAKILEEQAKEKLRRQRTLPGLNSPAYAYGMVEYRAKKIEKAMYEAGFTRAELMAQKNSAKATNKTLDEVRHQMALNQAFTELSKERNIPINILRQRYDDGQIEEYNYQNP
jgi:hypothetical protein